jgi:hypothetical protein
MALTLTEALLTTELRQYIGDDTDTFADRKLHRACITGLARLGRRRAWSFLRDTYPVNAVPDWNDGVTRTVAVAIGSTSLTFSGGNLPADIVTGGAWIEFNGQRRAYEFTVRGGNTTATIRNAYGNTDATDLTVATFRIFYPTIDLPVNFKSLRKVIDDGRDSELEIIESDLMANEHASYSGVGSPSWCSVRAKRNDPNIMQLWLYPSPDTQETYTILYNRIPGWYDSSTVATATFALEPTTTAYYCDWPLNLKDLLLASCKVSLISEGVKGLHEGAVLSEYNELVRAAEADDERQPEHEWLGRIKHPASETWRIGT